MSDNDLNGPAIVMAAIDRSDPRPSSIRPARCDLRHSRFQSGGLAEGGSHMRIFPGRGPIEEPDGWSSSLRVLNQLTESITVWRVSHMNLMPTGKTVGLPRSSVRCQSSGSSMGPRPGNMRMWLPPSARPPERDRLCRRSQRAGRILLGRGSLRSIAAITNCRTVAVVARSPHRPGR